MPMLARVSTATVVGVEALHVAVEVDVAFGLPGLTIVGLAGGAVLEARDRVRSAIRNSGYEVPARRITVNLAPADLPKEGTGYDLAIAIGILAASGQLPQLDGHETALLAELALDGQLRPLPGILALVDAARRAGCSAALVAPSAVAEGAVVSGIAVFGAATLGAAIGHLSGTQPLPRGEAEHGVAAEAPRPGPDLAEVIGQSLAVRALEIALAGRHHLLMEGPPGTGKTLLLGAATGLQPELDEQESIEVSRIYSVAGLLDRSAPVRRTRPVRQPHHTVSAQALVGGGPRVRPGEASLAHRGLLVLDELRHFRSDALDALRQPLESGAVTVARVDGAVTLPARFQLLAAANPCACGWRGSRERTCTCDEGGARRYAARVSGPLRDRVDLWVVMGEPTRMRLAERGAATSATAAARIAAAWQAQRVRQGVLNSDLPIGRLVGDEILGPRARRTLEREASRLAVNPRRTIGAARVARTIADLDGCETVSAAHVMESLHYQPGAPR
jgi:magnesium chelatase family protein